MTGDPDPIDQLSRALDQTGAIISPVQPDQATLPTPCSSWDVRGLGNHVVRDVQQFTARAIGEEWELQEADLVYDDSQDAYRQEADSLLAAWQRGGIDRMVELPMGEVPATWLVGQQIADIIVHAWDLAKATGQPVDFDPELVQLSLDWAQQNLKPEFRGDEASGRVFGPEVSVPPKAPLHDRLAGFVGRDPY